MCPTALYVSSKLLGAYRPAVILERPEKGPLYFRQVWLHRRLVNLHEQLCQAIACRLSDRVVVGFRAAHIVADDLMQCEVETASQIGPGEVGCCVLLKLVKRPPPVSQAALAL